MSALWTSAEIEAATGGTASAVFEVTGVTFDSREAGPGDLFVAMPGTASDGHDFVDQAFAQGAAAALVSTSVSGHHVLVPDVAEALTALAIESRRRTGATVIGVTGSVGKTSTKEALAAALERSRKGPVHRSVKSYNNHTGVPLSLARMPKATRFAVLELGMNHAGEIAALTRLVRPHVALVTAIASAHVEQLGSMEAIADAKGEIFEGLEEEGIAVIPEDSPYRDRLVRAARGHADRTITFGRSEDADVATMAAARSDEGGSLVTARLVDSELTFTLSQRGDHWISNAMAVLAVVEAVGGDLGAAGLALADLGGLKGRGERHRIAVEGGTALLIDESYNANPASMAATLASLGSEIVSGRRIAVLGPMRELGEESEAMHAALAEPVSDAKVERLVLVGDEMRGLAKALDGQIESVVADNVEEAVRLVKAILGPGDVVLVKASNSVGLAALVDRVAGGG
ncbi:MAG: UDP-N-acetylmuramoyl-tripeptide--D-alanyl-D-alanine ligase [Sphingomicrobium sp.]